MVTLNQKTVFKKVLKKVAKGEQVAITKEMRGVYSPATAKHPEKITKSKGWQELMDKHLPDTKLAQRHRELLDKREVFKMYNGEGKLIDQPDTQAVSKALDMGYKLKNRYPREEDGGNKTLIINISGESAQRYGYVHVTPQPEDSGTRPA